MITTIIVFLLIYFLIATEIIDKSIAAVIGGGLVVALQLIDYQEALRAIDLNVMALLVGMMIVVHILSETGVFEWLAIVLARLARGNGLVIMIFFMLITALLSAFLDNVTTVILMAPITILLTQLLEVPAAPLLIMEAILSNVGGTGTLIGDPPNILIGSKAGISFMEFIYGLSLPVAVMTVVLTGSIAFLMRKTYRTSPVTRSRISLSRPEKAIIQPVELKRALIVFGFILGGFFGGRFFAIEPGLVALVGAVVMLLVCRKPLHVALSHVEWDTILFFGGLFMMVGALEHHGVFVELGQFILKVCDGNFPATVMTILWFSALASMILNNIPLVMAMIPLVQGIIPAFAAQMGLEDPALIHTQISLPLYWALAMGACLGGNGTLVGASANVIVGQIANRNKCPITFWSFTRYGLPCTLASVVIANAYLYLRYFI